MRNLMIAGAMLFAAGAAQAEYKSGFGDVSINYLDWNHNPAKRANNAYIELEGASNYDWGELYGFVDFEHFNNDSDKYSFFAKGQFRYYLTKDGSKGLAFFMQGKPGVAKGFHEVNIVTGLSYNFYFTDAWFAPFFGALYTNKSVSAAKVEFAGWNGYQLGWSAGKKFNLLGQNWRVTNWNEIDFERKSSYVPRGADRESLNGALSLWWLPSGQSAWSPGIQYRYAWNTLGQPGLTDGYIATVKYNF